MNRSQSNRPNPIQLPSFMKQWHQRLFSNWYNSLISIVFMALVAYVGWHLLRWSVFDAVLYGDSKTCDAAQDAGFHGACWALIVHFWDSLLFGAFPTNQLWRPELATALFLAAMGLSLWRRLWWRGVIIMWVVVLIVYLWLLTGGLGLESIETDRWGGLTLTIVVAVYSLVPAFGLGILLALGRTSRLPFIKAICIGFIELIRGVPLISVLFMASVMVPLFFPAGIGVNKLTRAIIAFTLFEAAYMAESVRAGLQGLSNGQYEAADALGLSYWTKMRKVILPQALKLVVPPLVNNILSTFKDTSLVLVIGLYDLLTAAKVATRDVAWRDYYLEVFVFVGIIYFLFCLYISRYSQMVERHIHASQNRQKDR